MPGKKYASIQNPRMYRALKRRGFDKTAAARISNARTPGHTVKGLSATAPLVVAPTGPGGLLSTAGLGSASSRRRKLKARRKAFDEGKVTRDDTGKFSSGGGGGGTKTPPKKAPSGEGKTPQEIANQNRASVAQQTGLGSDLDGAMARLQAGMGGQGDEAKADQLVEQGLAKKDPITGRYSLSPEGKRYYAAAKKGDVDAAKVAMGDAADKKAGADAKRAEREGKRQAREQARQDRAAKLEAKRAEREAAKQKKLEAKPKKGGGGGKKDDIESLPPLFRSIYGLAGQDRAAGKSFAVTKDAKGRYRWIARTTTAYRDRDGEILSEAALDRDSQRMTATGEYGPLRWWHCGQPDEVALKPGPGIDLGTCDFSIVVGRTRIESGTFYDNAIGEVFAESAEDYELSPGFFHTPDQPRQGVFTHIHTFERSPVPLAHGRASNLFTGLAVKEASVTPEEYERRTKAFMAAMHQRGVPPETVAGVLAQQQTAEKAAQAQGIAYKSTEAQTVYQLPDGSPAIIVGNQLVALKAMDLKAPMPPAEMIEAGTTEAEDGMAEEAEVEGDDEGPILGPADVELIAGAVVAKLMAEMGGLQTQLNAFEQELKARGYARMKEAADQLGPKLDGLARILAQYVDDLPAAGHRASQDAGTVVRADDPVAAQGARNVGAKAAQTPRTPEERVLAWVAENNGGILPWDVPGRATLPDGVNPAQHAAPSTR